MATQAQAGTTRKTIPVTVENFVRAETNAYFQTYATGKGRELASIRHRTLGGTGGILRFPDLH
jgi:hypothetical protein